MNALSDIWVFLNLLETPIWVLGNMPEMAKSTSENMGDGQKRDLFWSYKVLGATVTEKKLSLSCKPHCFRVSSS
jgi:hypothetical protein